MLQLADYIVAPTAGMREIMSEFTDKGITVIPDPYEYEVREPHANGPRKLWFGHNVNLKAIEPFMALENLKVVTGPTVPPGCLPWSQQAMPSYFHDSNIALFPALETDYHKTNNRMINAINAGLFPICDPHPAYEDFRDVAWTSDIRTGLRFAKENSEDLNALVAEAQAIVEMKYSPAYVGSIWKELIDEIVA
ncbi:hypothetical protein OAA60_00680 [Porticoccaceae bacterium]|nr:hypothetical protein [Porticoccaceae bacterium]